jgi:hypothetical protein
MSSPTRPDLAESPDESIQATGRYPEPIGRPTDRELLASRPWFGTGALIVVTVVVVAFAGVIAAVMYLVPLHTLR